MYDPNLTKEEIRNYLHIYNTATDWSDPSVIDADASANSVRNKKIEAELMRRVLKLCEALIAERMWQNNREVPLISQRDVDDMITHLIITAIGKSDFFDGYDVGNQKAALDAMRVFAKPSLDAIARELSGPNAYDDEWRKIEAIRTLCVEKGATVEELAQVPGIGHELIRHVYNKEIYRAQLERSLDDARIGIAAFRVTAYQNALIECGEDLDEDLERHIREVARIEFDKFERHIIETRRRSIEEQMRRIWPE